MQTNDDARRRTVSITFVWYITIGSPLPGCASPFLPWSSEATMGLDPSE